MEQMEGRVLRNRTVDVNKGAEGPLKKGKRKEVNILLENERPWRIGHLVYLLAVILLFFWIFQTNFGFADGHSHSHGHDHDHDQEESPAYKYSRQANEKVKREPAHSHSHSHDEHHHEHHHDEHVHVDDHKRGPRTVDSRNPNLWVEAILSTLGISIAPFFILFLIPLDNSKEKKDLLKILLSFASGGLLGDAFLHLIPHAILAQGGDEQEEGHGHSHSHSHSHDHSDHGHGHSHDLSVGMWVLIGIIAFLVVEKFIRIMKGGHGHSHSHSVTESKLMEKDDKGKKESTKADGKNKKTDSDKNGPSDKTGTDKVAKLDKPPVHEEIKVAGYLNLAADFTHNFTDGLAIGASYLAGRSVGLITTVTILLHEVPHEIGDFAILIQSGCSKKKAIFLQLITAVGALSGTMVSLLAEGVGEAATAWILPFTAGGFIYIATVSVIPELLQESTFKQSLKEILALLAGVYMMVLIAQYE